MKDQAENLRKKVSQRRELNRAHTIAITSGKGGVGKSNFAINFALSLMEQGKGVLLVDLDLGFANVDVLLGLTPRYTLFDLLAEDLSPEQVVETVPGGLKIIAGASGLEQLLDIPPEQLERMFSKLEELEQGIDYIILDMGAGLATETMSLLLASDEIFLITTPEPTSITDAYAVLKILSNREEDLDIKLVVNRCSHGIEGLKTAQRIQSAAKRFLNLDIYYLGHLIQDQAVPQAVIRQQPFFSLFPHSKISQTLRLMAAQYLKRPQPEGEKAKGGLGGLIRRLIEPWKRHIS